jgi:N-acyl-D-aspartate/D-glutamate deacylase
MPREVSHRDTVSKLIQNLLDELGFVTPGFIDVHAHWNGFEARHPAKSWELETFLAYGVTTLHKLMPASIFLVPQL